MAEIRYSVCDMCGKRIEATYFLAKVKKTRKISIHLIRRVAKVFDTECNYELCVECGEAVQAFITTRAVRNNGAAQAEQDSRSAKKAEVIQNENHINYKP